MDQESSFELIERAQAGDRTALDRLLERYRPRLLKWATGRLPQFARNLTDTDDLVQDAMIGTFRNLAVFEQRDEWALQSYLRKAVSNRIRDELRRHDVRPVLAALDEVNAPAGGQTPLEALLGQEAFKHYEMALNALTETEREAVIARLELGCSYAEIADLLGKPSADAARMFVTRALARLVELMSQLLRRT